MINFSREEKFSALPSKNKVVDEKKLVQSGFFISHLGFRRQQAEFFFSKKILQMKAGQYKIYSTNPDIILQSPIDDLFPILSFFTISGQNFVLNTPKKTILKDFSKS